MIFNIVFFITLLSLVMQGMSISWFARKLHLDLPPEPENTFDIHIPDEMSSSLNEVTLTAEMLAHGNTLAKMHIPQGHLAMMVKRGSQYLVPNGQLELQEGDTLLFISSNEHNPEA